MSKYVRICFVLCGLFSLLVSSGLARGFRDVLPSVQDYQIDIVTPSGDVEYSYTSQMKVDTALNQIVIKAEGSSYTSHSMYDMNLHLLQSQLIVTSAEDQERIGFDQRMARLTDDNLLVVEFFLDQQLQDDREVKVPEETVDIESLGLYLQGLMLQGITEFHGNLFDINSANKFNRLRVDFMDVSALERLNRKSNFPPQVAAFMEDTQRIQVISLGLAGLVRIFFPHRFYVVLENEAPYHILGFWGGSSAHLRYHVYTRM